MLSAQEPTPIQPTRVTFSPVAMQSSPDLSRLSPVSRSDDRISVAQIPEATVPQEQAPVAPAPMPTNNPLATPEGSPTIPSMDMINNPFGLAPIAPPNTNLEEGPNAAFPTNSFNRETMQDMPLPVGMTREGNWSMSCIRWQSALICSKPLYFEEPMLERNSQQRFPCLQPVISGGRFFGRLATLPYHMQMNPPWENQYLFGYYRPGTSAPALFHRPPYRADAATVQGVATAATFIAVP